MEIRALEAKHFEERLKLSEYAFQFKLTPSQREQNEQNSARSRSLAHSMSRGATLGAYFAAARNLGARQAVRDGRACGGCDMAGGKKTWLCKRVIKTVA